MLNHVVSQRATATLNEAAPIFQFATQSSHAQRIGDPTILDFVYGKTLLTPGQRIGYLALPPTMPERAALHSALMVAQLANGYAFPNALLQYALPDLEKLSIDDVMEIPGCFRVSLTANDGMIERALPGFAAAIRDAQ